MIFNVGDVPYVKTKFSGLDGKTKVGWAEEGSDFEVLADQTGVYFRGKMKNPLGDFGALQEFAAIVQEAWIEHGRLRPKITTGINDLHETQL